MITVLAGGVGAVREMLSKHALVRSHASAPPRKGGDGVTLVELAV